LRQKSKKGGIRKVVRRTSRVAEEEKRRKSFSWPKGYKSAAVFSVDVDASAIEYHPLRANSGHLSAGDYGPRAGLPRILDLFDKHGIKSTFFVPGWVAERFPERIKEIHERGHELAAHGYLHENLGHVTDKEEKEIWEKTSKILSDITGTPVKGFRPSGHTTERAIRLADSVGWHYRVNALQTYYPGKLKMEDGTETEIVEMPWTWIFDDMPFFWSGVVQGPILSGFMPISSPSEALEYWITEFESIHEIGGLTDITIHPRASGRPSRVRALDKLIRYIKATPGVWFTSPREVAEWVLVERR